MNSKLLFIFLFLIFQTGYSQNPFVSLSVSKNTIQENNDSLKVTASLNQVASQDIIIDLKLSGIANYQKDFDVKFLTKGLATTVAGGNGKGFSANQLSLPNGVFVDNAGNIFVSDMENHRIQKWATSANFGVTVAGGNGYGSANNQIIASTGVFIDLAGNIYVSDSENHRIQKWEPGASSGVTVAGGNGIGSANNQLNFPTGVFVDLEGNIYVSDKFNHRIQKWAPGASSGVTVAGGNASGSAANQLSYPEGVFVDLVGNIFISDLNNLRIQKWAPGASAGVTVAGGNGYGLAANQLSYPNGVCLDLAGNIYVSDYLNNRIQKWTPGASTGFTVAGGNGNGSAANQLDVPWGVFVDLAGNIFVSDFNNHRIQKVQYQPQIIIPAGSNTASITLKSIDDNIDELDESVIIGIDKATNANVASNFTSTSLTILDNDSPPNLTISSVNSDIQEEGGAQQIKLTLNSISEKPISLDLDVSGSALLNSDYTLNQTSVTFAIGDSVKYVTLTPINDSKVEAKKSIIIGIKNAINLGNSSSLTLNLISEDKPSVSLALNKSSINEYLGEAIITATIDSVASKDIIIDLKLSGTANYQGDYDVNFPTKGIGTTVAGGNGKGAAANQLDTPFGIFSDTQGNIYITDLINSRVQKWAPGATSGVTVAGGNGRGSGANQLDYPNDVFVDSFGNIFIADSWNHRIQKWAPGATNGVTVAGGNGSGAQQNQLKYPTGIFIDANGTFYISDSGNNRIQKWTVGVNSGVTVAGGNGIGPASNQLNFPIRIFVDSNENIYIADSNNHRIQKWTPGATNGITVAGGNGKGANSNQLDSPYDVIIDPFNNVIISDYGNHRIQNWTPGASSGVTISGGNGIGSANNQFNHPNGISIGEINNIYIVDTDNHRVQKFQNQPQIIIPAGTTSGNITLKAIEDKITENDETIIISIDTAINTKYSLSQSISLTLKNNSITFTKQSNSPVPKLTSSSLSWGDYDLDGDQDLAIMGSSDFEGYVTRVYKNNNGVLVNTNQNIDFLTEGDIKWVDLNKDSFLDLIYQGLDFNNLPQTKVYLSNKSGGFLNITNNLGLDNLYGGSIEFGDLDNDGDLDLGISGKDANNNAYFYLYERLNESLIYQRITDFYAPNWTLNNNKNLDFKFGDFDGDGDLDIIYHQYGVKNSYKETGSFSFYQTLIDPKIEIAKLINSNTSNVDYLIIQSNGQLISNQTITPSISILKNGSVAAGDYNNDGMTDFVYSGLDESNLPKSYLYYQSIEAGVPKFLKDDNIQLEGLFNSSANWVDYDVDGDLDLFMTGENTTGQQSFFYINNTGIKTNTPPAVPSNLKVTDKGNGFVEFSWKTPKDDHSTSLGYNIRIGTTSNGSELTNTQTNFSTGSLLITQPASIYDTTYTTQLNPGKYYWSVQAIDQGYQGSPFASEQQLILQYKWKLVNQRGIVNRSITKVNAPKIAMIDIDNDKDMDMFVGNGSGREFYKYEKGQFRKVNLFMGSSGVENVISADVNSDGYVDLVVSTVNNSLEVLINNGSGNFGYYFNLTSLYFSKIKVLDMDNDGKQEIVIIGKTTNQTNGQIAMKRWEIGSNGSFNVSETVSLPNMTYSSYDLGDFDNDSKPDLVISGFTSTGIRTEVYKNTTIPGEILSMTKTLDNLGSVKEGTLNLVDFDGDKDLDVMITGSSAGGPVFLIYQNTLSNGVANFSKIETGLNPFINGKIKFGDFDSNGYLDMFYNGTQFGSSSQVSDLVEYNSSLNKYEKSNFDYGGIIDAEFAFADIENDGDLDLVLAGNDINNSSNQIFNVLLNVRNESAALNSLVASVNSSKDYSKNSSTTSSSSLNRLVSPINIPVSYLGTSIVYNSNAAPSAPVVKGVTSFTQGTSKLVKFAWNASSDDNTPTTGLAYNLRIGTTPTNDDILATNASSEGILKTPYLGNAELNLEKVMSLPNGKYYWSVQAIDASFKGSKFSNPIEFSVTDGSVSTNNPPLAVNQSYDVTANITLGAMLATVSATDPEGDALSYQITAGNSNGWFSINSLGQILIASVPTNLPDKVVITISVSDGKNIISFDYTLIFCQSTFRYSNLTDGVLKTFKASKSIEATSKILGASKIIFDSKNNIILNPGFEVQAGSTFEAKIGAGCN